MSWQAVSGALLRSSSVQNQIDTAAENLLKIKRQIEEDPRGKPPAVLGVLCGMSNAAYRRVDGVFVVPITALKP